MSSLFADVIFLKANRYSIEVKYRFISVCCLIRVTGEFRFRTLKLFGNSYLKSRSEVKLYNFKVTSNS